MRGKRRGQEGRKREREGEVRRRPIEKKKKKTFVSRSRARASLRDETIAPAGRMRREVPKGARGIEKQRARDACVGEAEKESERERSNAFSLLPLFAASPFLFPPCCFLLFALLFDHSTRSLPTPRAPLLRSALIVPTHRAGATRRGRCDATGREARKEDLDAERLCMIRWSKFLEEG